ncbi:hypothetical protein M5K25_016487 [Dendrobium thyrsiflorum]|uniref:Uncharacterized protein n=1 Tax=Dendrobium thyrsiflorum TaxID=117978 RepID=A0ABD0URR7_DENTH
MLLKVEQTTVWSSKSVNGSKEDGSFGRRDGTTWGRDAGETSRMEERFFGIEGRFPSMESCFGNMKGMMKTLIKMQSKASPATPRADWKGKKVQEDDDEPPASLNSRELTLSFPIESHRQTLADDQLSGELKPTLPKRFQPDPELLQLRFLKEKYTWTDYRFRENLNGPNCPLNQAAAIISINAAAARGLSKPLRVCCVSLRHRRATRELYLSLWDIVKGKLDQEDEPIKCEAQDLPKNQSLKTPIGKLRHKEETEDRSGEDEVSSFDEGVDVRSKSKKRNGARTANKVLDESDKEKIEEGTEDEGEKDRRAVRQGEEGDRDWEPETAIAGDL